MGRDLSLGCPLRASQGGHAPSGHLPASSLSAPLLVVGVGVAVQPDDAEQHSKAAAVSECGWRGSLPSSFYSSKDSEHPASHPGLVIPATHAEVASASRDP